MSTKPFFLKDVKKFYAIIFWRIRNEYVSSQPFCWLKLWLVDFFLWYPFQFNSHVPDTTGGSSRHELKRFWSINLFLEDAKKIFDFHFLTCAKYIFLKSNVTNVIEFVDSNFMFCRFSFQAQPIFLVCSCYSGGFFPTSIGRWKNLNPFLRRLLKILHFRFLTRPTICILLIFSRFFATIFLYCFPTWLLFRSENFFPKKFEYLW